MDGGFYASFRRLIGRLGRILDQAGVKIADSAPGKPKGILPEKLVKVIIDELPAERGIAGCNTACSLTLCSSHSAKDSIAALGSSKPRRCLRVKPLTASASGTKRSETGRTFP